MALTIFVALCRKYFTYLLDLKNKQMPRGLRVSLETCWGIFVLCYTRKTGRTNWSAVIFMSLNYKYPHVDDLVYMLFLLEDIWWWMYGGRRWWWCLVGNTLLLFKIFNIRRKGHEASSFLLVKQRTPIIYDNFESGNSLRDFWNIDKIFVALSRLLFSTFFT